MSSGTYRKVCFYLLLCALPGLFLQADKALTSDADKRNVIVIDPGHGGNDTGATGMDDVHEKDVALPLAQMTAALLDDRFRVELTRNDDFSPDFFDRTGKANHLKADLFISLHAGASDLSSTKGIVIFCHEPSTTSVFLQDFNSETTATEETEARPWSTIQERHQHASQTFAQTLRESFRENLGTVTIRIRKAPVAVLMGADMPAALIEIGYLTHPSEGKQLQDRDRLAAYAKAIADAAAEFLGEKGEAGQ